MGATPKPTIARGIAFVAALSALVVVGQYFASTLPQEQASASCSIPVQLVGDPSIQIICAEQPPWTTRCGSLQAGDRVHWAEPKCDVVRGGMAQPMRLTVGLPMRINEAQEDDIALLEGVGPSTAKRIVEDRNRHGPFASVEELARVKGVGPKTIAALRHQITVE